jgi:small subunit ribosomal protein S2
MSTQQDISMRELLEAGAHFGHQSRRWNPKMKPYIYQSRDNIHVIDLAQTAQGLQEACDYIRDLIAAGGNVLFVGTKRQAKDLLKEHAKAAGMPFVVERWVGGMLTNWDTIQKNIGRYKTYKRQLETGELAQYTKKEQSLIAKETERLEKVYEGLVDIDKIPDVLFVVDVRKEKIAVKEAKRRGIPIIGVCDTNCDPTLVDIVIPANDDALKAIEYIVTRVTSAAAAGRAKVGTVKKDDEEVTEDIDAKPKRKAKAKKDGEEK